MRGTGGDGARPSTEGGAALWPHAMSGPPWPDGSAVAPEPGSELELVVELELALEFVLDLEIEIVLEPETEAEAVIVIVIVGRGPWAVDVRPGASSPHRTSS